MKGCTTCSKTVILVTGSLILSYYILMARQAIRLSIAVYSDQFWFMLTLGAVFLYAYFRFSIYLNQKVGYSTKISVYIFLIVRMALGVWIPSVLVLYFLQELFRLLNLDFKDSSYLDIAYFILMVVFYSTTIGFIALYFYNEYQRIKVSIINNSPRFNLMADDTERKFMAPNYKDEMLLLPEARGELDRQINFKRELADMLLHVVLIRRRKNNILLFRDDGNCDFFVHEIALVDLFINEEAIIQINRWIWVNSFYVKGIRRENNEDCITLDEDLELKFRACKSLHEPHAQNQMAAKSNLFIGRSYKRSVKLRFKNYKG